MRRQLVRAALLLYPSAWRQRYGDELEQLMLDCGAGRSSLMDSTRLLVDVTGTGLAERIRSCGTRTRIVAVACLCAAAAIAVDAGTLTASDTLSGGDSPLGIVWLAPNAFVDTNVTFVHAPAWEFPASFQPLPRRVTVQLVPGTSRVVGIAGPPSTSVINPKTGEIVALKAGA